MESTSTPLEVRAREVLREILDPEIYINIVDLGLLIRLTIEPPRARVELIMTSPTCPLSGFFDTEIRAALGREFPELRDIEVVILNEPLWSPERMSARAKTQMGWG